jgi:protocatechuate 3,4-dioxygenase beta subunit
VTRKNTLAFVLSLAVVAIGACLALHRGCGVGEKAAPKQDPKKVTQAADPWGTAAKSDTQAAPRGMAPRWSLDLDPEGPLRMEGQVVDVDGHGVGGADVWLGSVPPRSTKTEGDGTFTFDKLVGRTYAVSAKTAQEVGGPVEYKLTEKSDPVIVKLGVGAKLVVTVHEEDKKPIAGADVTLVGEGNAVTKTTDGGIAKIAPVHPGWVAIRVSAPGHATQSAFTTIGSAGATGQLDVTLHKGIAVAGRVVDEAGKPIAKARVTTAAVWDIPGGIEPSVTDDKGQFSLALAAGSHTLVVNDGDHAPGHSPPVTVADRPVSNVEIVMKVGGMIAGTVVDATKKPVPFATLRVAGKGGEMWNVASRQTTADRAGKFELHGLAREKLQARAESDVAASKLVEVDLAAQPAKKDLEVVLDVTGTIAGTVVDDAGQPVAEVTVNAFPDLMGGASGEGLALAGMSSATTDGGGAFTIRGLPSESYRITATRTTRGQRDWGQSGITAKTGDTNVKITLPLPGKLVGKITVEGATGAPRLAFVQIGYDNSTPASAGAFEVDDLAPGTYDARFYGPEFADLRKHDVKIEAGKTTDLGTVTVVHGRKLVGTVVDANGTPVAGAKVKVGDMMFQVQGAEEQMDTFEQASGARVTITDQDGAFTLIGIAKKRTSVMADHPDRGRSNAVEIADGEDDPAPLTLALRGFGVITGKVTLKGQPATGVTITDTPKGGGAQIQIAKTDDAGAFTIAKASEGTHVLSAMQQGGFGMSLKSTSTTVQVTAGKPTTVAIDIPVGTITLTVQVRALPGNKVDAAQVFLFRGVVAAANAKELTEGFLAGNVSGMKFWFGDGKPMPDFDELVSGDYSVCSVPITGSLADPTMQQRIQEHMDLLRVYCKSVKVTPSPDKQVLVQDLPAMVTLPAPKS